MKTQAKAWRGLKCKIELGRRDCRQVHVMLHRVNILILDRFFSISPKRFLELLVENTRETVVLYVGTERLHACLTFPFSYLYIYSDIVIIPFVFFSFHKAKTKL